MLPIRVETENVRFTAAAFEFDGLDFDAGGGFRRIDAQVEDAGLLGQLHADFLPVVPAGQSKAAD